MNGGRKCLVTELFNAKITIYKILLAIQPYFARNDLKLSNFLYYNMQVLHIQTFFLNTLIFC